MSRAIRFFATAPPASAQRMHDAWTALSLEAGDKDRLDRL
jgi:hypothetical protein